MRNDSGSFENDEIQKIIVPDSILKPSISLLDIENMTSFEGSRYQNIEKWICNFENQFFLFNLSDLRNLKLAKPLMKVNGKLLMKSEKK